jgi:hypothetical protein
MLHAAVLFVGDDRLQWRLRAPCIQHVGVAFFQTVDCVTQVTDQPCP